MSWMTCRGSIYHCQTCGSDIRVEYEGGALLTHVGEVVCWEQQALNARYGKPADSDGEYLHEEGLCASCVVPRRAALERELVNPGVAAQLQQVLDRIGVVDAAYADKAMAAALAAQRCLIEGFTLADARRVAPDVCAATLDSKRFRVTSFRERLVEEFIRGARGPLVALAAEATTLAMPHPDPQRQALTESARILVDGLGTYWWVEVDVSMVTNLTAFTGTHRAVRRPVADTPAVLFYFEGKMDRAALLSGLDRPTRPGPEPAAFLQQLATRLNALGQSGA